MIIYMLFNVIMWLIAMADYIKYVGFRHTWATWKLAMSQGPSMWMFSTLAILTAGWYCAAVHFNNMRQIKMMFGDVKFEDVL